MVDAKTVISVYVPVEMKKWIDNRPGSRSEFFRELIRREMKKEEGFKSEITDLEEEIKDLSQRLDRKHDNLFALEEKQRRFETKKQLSEVKSIIKRALNNITYDSWQEAANDLEESRGIVPSQEFRRMVKEQWEECGFDQ